MEFDDEMEIEKIKRDIIEILKKHTYSDLKFKQFIAESMPDDSNIKSKQKTLIISSTTCIILLMD